MAACLVKEEVEKTLRGLVVDQMADRDAGERWLGALAESETAGVLLGASMAVDILNGMLKSGEVAEFLRWCNRQPAALVAFDGAKPDLTPNRKILPHRSSSMREPMSGSWRSRHSSLDTFVGP